jgi:hypothetical protein
MEGVCGGATLDRACHAQAIDLINNCLASLEHCTSGIGYTNRKK